MPTPPPNPHYHIRDRRGYAAFFRYLLLPVALYALIVSALGVRVAQLVGPGPVFLGSILLLPLAIIPPFSWFHRVDLEMTELERTLEQSGFRPADPVSLDAERAAAMLPHASPGERLPRVLIRNSTREHPVIAIAWIGALTHRHEHLYCNLTTITVECNEDPPPLEGDRTRQPWTTPPSDSEDQTARLLRKLHADEASRHALETVWPSVQRLDTRARTIRMILCGTPRAPIILAALRTTVAIENAMRRG